ncbi:hypothetical protein N7510_010429 [Penicillium lagena]|uniref:uncharacterized protein n=1 Tax=Penicillium lagena TaxID=94218 RepID=UPI002540A90B|nr:uncharacterized protein N7510_010429 [Penicillium lagena]KAJ5605275.1 hypothetical protein N7510_010429 [Penicillium lagena]
MPCNETGGLPLLGDRAAHLPDGPVVARAEHVEAKQAPIVDPGEGGGGSAIILLMGIPNLRQRGE